MADDLPQQFGRYTLCERVGRGGMAEVFRATVQGFRGFDSVVAIKRMFGEYASDPTFVEMLTDEAKIVSQLSHPNIVQILDVGRVQGDYYIGFEYVEGVDLFRLLQRHHDMGRDLPIGLSCYIVAELCSALDYAHGRRGADGTPLRIVHRDVSPQNVLLSMQGEVKLTDFGIAKASSRFGQTQAGLVKGKIYYMSPEQVSGQDIDHRSDLFAAGILLYEALTTQPCYDVIDQRALYEAVAAAQWQWPESKLARIPQSLRAVVEQALAADRGARFQSGRALRDGILQAARQAGLAADREEFGQYIRSLYAVEADHPVSIVHLAPRVDPLEVHETRWNSKVAQLKPLEADTTARAKPNARSSSDRPMDGRPSRVNLPQPGLLSPESATGPADRDRPPPLRPSSADVPRPPVEAAVVAVARPSPRPQPAASPAPIARPAPISSSSVPSVRATGPRPMPSNHAQGPRPPPPGALHSTPAKPKAMPAAEQSGHGDEATSMLDRGEIERRLASLAGNSQRPAEPASEAATRFADAMPEGDDLEDTTQPKKRKVPTAQANVQPRLSSQSVPRMTPLPANVAPAQARPPANLASGQAKPPVNLTMVQPPAAVAIIDEDELPAGWRLIGLAAAVWMGAVVLGVYATLITIR